MGNIVVNSVFVDNKNHHFDAKSEIKLSVTVAIGRDRDLEQELTIKKMSSMWVAEIAMDEFPGQESPEDACNKLSEWLLALSRGVKGKNIKHLNIEKMFNRKYFK